MKKMMLGAIILLIIAGTVFAQSYAVESVTGSAQRENGTARVNLKTGDTLSADTVIHTAAGASVVLKFGEKTITIPASRSGRVSELFASGSGLRISGSVTRVDTTAAVRTGGQTGTASARSSDAADDINIDAE